MSLWVKICGITSATDGALVADAGADAIGLNFVPSSPRFLTEEMARQVVDAVSKVSSRPQLVGVFADESKARVLHLVRLLGLDAIQLHGDESPEGLNDYQLQGLDAFKALRIGSAEDARRATSYPGERILVDAKVDGALGGTGHTFDWTLIEQLNRQRELILAGGLTPDNIADAVLAVNPFGVDTASGVESAPGVKDVHLVRRFIERARLASKD